MGTWESAVGPGKTHRPMRRAAFALFILATFAIRAQEPVAPKPWTPADIVTTEHADGFEISPDGTQVVWSKTTVDLEEQKHEAQLELTDLASLETIELTQGPHDSGNPKWSPDGKRIAFLSDRPDPKFKGEPPEGANLWLIRPNGGEAWPLTRVLRGVSNFAWAGSETIVFTAQEDPALYEQERKEKKDTSIAVDDEDHAPPVRMFAVDIESSTITRLSDNTDRIEGLWVSPDGEHAVTAHEESLRYGYDQKVRPKAFLWALEGMESKEILTDKSLNLAGLEWEPDSKGFYFASDTTTSGRYVMASESRLFHYDLESAKYDSIPLQTGRGLMFGSIKPLPDGVLAILEDGVRSRLATFRKVGGEWKKQDLAGDHVANTFSIEVDPAGKTLVYAYSKANVPEQWYAGQLDSDAVKNPKQLTHSNPWTAERKLGQTEVFRWKGAKDEEVEGMLYYPLSYEPGKKYPLVLMIHGGPLYHDPDTWNDSWADPVHLFTQRGAFVLKPNYHGSSGYGLAFAESISAGNYYTLPLEDCEKGVAALIARGFVDPDKLGTMGWSNGAILSAALIAKDPRFKAASVGAGGADWTADWGFCAFGQAFSNYYLGKAPIEDPELYRKNAPIYDFDKVRTPTIFFHGTEDRAVPTFHSWSMYNTLQYLGKVPTKLVLFPGEPHGIGKPAHVLRKMEEELAWFDRYLFKSAPAEPKNEALKEGSMLADFLELAKAKRAGGRYGEIEKGVLVPETVAFEGLQLGRFEVTRAQFAAFEPSYKIELGQENYPANDIGFEKAKAYCDWLSKKTGRPYRLPTAEEGQRIYSNSGAAENTLDAWAGYAVNPDDMRRLREIIAKLTGSAPLTKEVGSFSGVGREAKVFDLGGNVAEWVTPAAQGHPFPMGGSADAPADERADTGPASEYVGLRVVLDSK